MKSSKLMPLEELSNIKGALESESVSSLFEFIKKAVVGGIANLDQNNIADLIVSPGNLREDIVVDSTETERELIIKNFPKEEKGYLVVSKVIES